LPDSGAISFINSGNVAIQSGNTLVVQDGSDNGSVSVAFGAYWTFGNGNLGFTLESTASVTGLGTEVVTGTLYVASSLPSLQNLTVSGTGTVDLTNNLTINGLLTWNGGTLEGTGSMVVANTATLNLTGGSMFLDGSLVNNGTATWSGGDMYFTSATLTNNSSFTVTAPSLIAYAYENANNAFVNNGTFTSQTGGTTSFTVYNSGAFINFNNFASVAVQSGDALDLLGGSGNGSWSLGSGATLNPGNYTFQNGASVTGLGTLLVTATVDIAGSLAGLQNLTVSSGILNSAGTETINGLLTWGGGTLEGTGSVVVANTGTLNLPGGQLFLDMPLVNNGTATWSGGSLYFTSATLTNNASFTVTMPSLFAYGYQGVNNAFVNNGTFTSQAGGPTYFTLYNSGAGINFNNYGNVVIQSLDTLSLQDGSGNGSWSIGSGATLNLAYSSGNYTLQNGASVTGLGSLLVTGTVAIAGPLPSLQNLTVSSGIVDIAASLPSVQNLTISGTGIFSSAANQTINGLFTWAGGTLEGTGSVLVANAGTMNLTGAGGSMFLDGSLVNNGTATWSGGYLYFSAATLTNNASFTVTTPNLIAYAYVTVNNAFINNGTFTSQTGGATTFSIYNGGSVINFNNNGKVAIQGGDTLSLQAGSGSGSWSVGSLATLNLGTYTLQDGAFEAGAGTVLVNGAVLTALGTVVLGNLTLSSGIVSTAGNLAINGLFTWQGGTLEGAGNTVIAPAGTIDLTGTSGSVLLEGSLDDAGAFNWTGGSFDLEQGTFTNNGTFTANTTSTLDANGYYSTNNAFINNGTFTNQGSGTVTFVGYPSPATDAIAFNNNGTLNVSAGTVSLQSTVTQVSGTTLTGGTWIVAAGATLTMAGASIAANNGNVTLQGPGASFAALNALVSNTGSLAFLGGLGFSTAGAFTNTGALTVGAGGNLGVAGTFTEGAAGSLNVQVGGTSLSGQFSRIMASAAASLNGALNVALVNGFVPTAPDTYPIVQASSSSGTFSSVTGLQYGTVPFFNVSYPGTGAHLNAFAVPHGPATHFSMITVPTTTAGASFPFMVTAQDAFGNTATSGFSGTVHFSSSDSQAVFVPSSTSTLSGGSGTFTATLKTAGLQSLSASDTSVSNLSGTSNPIIVSPAAATHFAVVAPANATAGIAILVSLTPLDQYGNTASGYGGFVHFTSSDPIAKLPIDFAFNGLSSLHATEYANMQMLLVRAGGSTVTATDTVTPTITGHSGPIIVSPAPASHFVWGLAGTATAGVSIRVTLTGDDQFNNTATGYTGTVAFASSDTASTVSLPANSTLTSGQGTFSVTLTTAGSQFLTATDTVTSSITGVSGPISVSPGPTSHFGLSGPGTATAGNTIVLSVTAFDQFNNTATGYIGTTLFSSTDLGPSTVLPAASTLASGVGTFSATLTTAGMQTITATDKTNALIIGKIIEAINHAKAKAFRLLFPGLTTAGNLILGTVTAQDPFGNTVTDYTGTVSITSSDHGASTALPPNMTLTSGTGIFSCTLTTAGTQTVTGTDTVTSSLTGASNPILVVPGPASYFGISGPGTATAGNAIVFSVIAFDLFNNTATGYTGTTLFSSSDLGASTSLPPASTLASGVGTFSATLTTAGNQTVTATDKTTSSITGSKTVVITAAALKALALKLPSITTAGNPFGFTVLAEDRFGNTYPGYTGTATFTSTDTGASTKLPAPSALVSGLGNFSATLTTAGNQTITATDAPNSVSGTSNTITVSAAAAAHYVVTDPTTTAGVPVPFTVAAEDKFNNTATGYTGTATFTSTDTGASTKLPAPSTLVSGLGTFSATLTTAGTQKITATDAPNSVTGTSPPITVVAAAATHFVVSAGSPTVAGNNMLFTVVAEDKFNNTATGYGGNATFTSTDTGASTKLPAPSPLVSGLGTFSATLTTAGTQAITATDAPNSVTGTSNTITVTAASATHFAVTAPGSTTAGNPIAFVVTAEDPFNNTATGYAGTTQFTSSDSQVVFFSPTATLTSGSGSFAATLKTAGNQTITGTDTAANTITGVTAPILVTAAHANHFIVTAAALPSYPGVPGAYPPSQSPAPAASFVNTGAPVVFTATAFDPFGNIDHNYRGTVGFVSTDTAASLPGNSTLSAGQSAFSATLQTPGNQFITATDVSTPSITGASSAIVTRGLVVISFTPTPSGFVITFNKPFNPSSVLIYTNATTPDDIILKGTATQPILGSALFNSPTAPTSITFVKTDVVSAVGTFNPGSGLLSAGNYTVTLRSYSASTTNGFLDSLGGALDGTDQGNPGVNYVYTFSVSAAPTAVGIPDFARGASNTDAVFLPTTIGNGNTFNLVYTNPNTSPATGTATVTFSTIGATLQANIQAALNALPQIGLGAGNVPNAVVVVNSPLISNGVANVQVTFQNSGFVTATNQLLSSTSPTPVTFSLANINAANNIAGNGIPLALSNSQNVTSGSFTLQYNPTLLSITGGAKGAALNAIAGSTFTVTPTINNATSATAVISFSSPSKISSTTASLTLGSLLATVPFSATASYGAKQLLHFSSEQLNTTASSNIAVTNQDAVEVAAFFGNVSGNDVPFSSSGDQPLIGVVGNESFNAALDTLPGFSAFPNLDPIIIGGVSQAGQPAITNSGDAGTMLKELTTPQPAIPWLPAGLPMNTMGPDPTLSVVDGGQWTVASGRWTVIVPVNIDTARPQGSTGMVEAVLALTYNPNIFDVSAADVQLGTVPEGGSGWQLKTEINAQAGLIGVELYSNTPIQSALGGSLVTIAMHVRGEPGVLTPGVAPTTALTLVPYVDPAGGPRMYQTSVADNQAEFVIHMESGQRPADGTTAPDNALDIEHRTSNIGPGVDIAHRTSRIEPTPDLGPSPNSLSGAVVEQVFGDPAQPAAYSLPPTAYSFVPPSAVLTSESDEQATNAIRDLALLQAPFAMSQPSWLSDDSLAYLGQSSRRLLLTPNADLLAADGGSSEPDWDDFSALEALSAGEARPQARWGEKPGAGRAGG